MLSAVCVIAAIVLSGSGQAMRAAAQEVPPAAVAERVVTVQLNFPQEIPIQTLVEFVGKRLQINILYDKEIADKRINIKAASNVPIDSLLGVLESALKISGLALVDAEVPGWKKIVKAEQLPTVAQAIGPGESAGAPGQATAVTQAFVLKNANTQEVEPLIKPFLTQPGANIVPVPRSNTLIVTDYATNIQKIAKLIESIDRPKAAVAVEFVPVQNQSVTDLSTQLATVLSAKSRARGHTRSRDGPRSALESNPGDRPGRRSPGSTTAHCVTRQAAGPGHENLPIHQRPRRQDRRARARIARQRVR
jgi:type II secretory pathway component GspD/PulD (secretin)